MQPYHKIPQQPVPQSQPLRDDQELNAAGGYAWRVDKWTQLDRFLILGSIGGTYYLSERDLTFKNLGVLDEVIAEDPLRVVKRTVEVSQNGLAFKNDPALYVLALVAAKGQPPAKALALGAMRSVARVPTHLFHFIQYYKSLGGRWGRSLRTAIGLWYTNRSNMQLAYHLTKYQQRDGWANADLIRLSHPKPQNATQSWLFAEALNKDQTAVGVDIEAFAYMRAVDALKAASASTAQIARVIEHYRLPREVVPTHFLNSAEVWGALLRDMPLTALIRNLGKMSQVGLINAMSGATGVVVEKLQSAEQVERSRLHPLQVLLAAKVYEGGAGVRGSLTWTPSQVVLQALNVAFGHSFKNAQPSGKRMLVALDISGSMTAFVPGDTTISCYEAGAAIMKVLGETEPLIETVVFSAELVGSRRGGSVYRLPTRGRSVGDLLTALNIFPNGGTDLAQPFLWASREKVPVDCFVVITDNETWAGNIHAQQALEAYRKEMNINSRVIVLSCAANQHSVADPKDSLAMNAVGFDASICALVSRFAKGEF